VLEFPEMLRGIYAWIQAVLEEPIDPLTGQQSLTLKALSIDGLVMEPDKHSVSAGLHPKCMYAFFRGTYIGTAYGNKFVPPREIIKDDSLRGIAAKIEASYLPMRAGRKNCDEELSKEAI
jgi:hypothetical protein